MSSASVPSSSPVPPVPSAMPSGFTTEKEPIGFVTILLYGWEPGLSEVRLKFPPGAEAFQPNAAAEQARFRARMVADLDEAIAQLGAPEE